MRKLNDHVKEVMNITLTEKTIEPKKVKIKTDYTKPILWVSVGVITITLWTIIYNLIF